MGERCRFAHLFLGGIGVSYVVIIAEWTLQASPSIAVSRPLM